MKKANRILTILIFIFLYIPMIVLLVASFNTGKDITHFEGFTFQQYVRLFRDEGLLQLLRNSLIISIAASLISTVFGTLAAIGIYHLRPRLRKIAMGLTNIPMTNPDIVTGVSLSLLFVFVGSEMLGHKNSLTFWTLLIAHITFNLPYVILNVMPKLHQLDPALRDAAMDLGCTPVQSFFKVTLHEIMPGIVAGGIMAFTMSLDDFVISYFVTGPDFVTLPVQIYADTKKPLPPKIYAMFTLLFLLILVLMVSMNLIQMRSEHKKATRRAMSGEKGRIIQRTVAVALILVLLFSGIFILKGHKQDTVTINVYNWGQYLSMGDDDTLDVIAAFEEKYPNIKVQYSYYDSNEVMYSKIASGGITVDVIFPSDYMIGRMREEGLLQELNFDNIPNYQYIDEAFRNQSFDPENKYSVPYTWGTVGIIYNKKYVDPADVTGWELLWNPKYAGKILMFDNSRDAFGITQYMSGYDVNTTDKAELDACAAKLEEQHPILQQYVMDQIFSTMENEEAWIAPYYAGDYLAMAEANPDLGFYLPHDQGFNLFIDAMCIPKCAEQKEAAETFINFLCDPEICGKNMNVLGYSVPETAAKAYLDPEVAESPVAYPSPEILENGTSFSFLPEETTRYMERLFMKVRNG